jgi:broad specificity phosphatase PhoE
MKKVGISREYLVPRFSRIIQSLFFVCLILPYSDDRFSHLVLSVEMGPSRACRFTLVRHGETEWNRTGRWQGQSDVPLSPQGREQAARLGRRLAGEGVSFTALYSSDLSRAWETAEIIGAAIGLKPVAAPALREIDLGAWAGKTREEIMRAFPGEWERIQYDDPPRETGETFADFQARVLGWIDRMARENDRGRICAVTHGGCIRAALLRARGLTWAERERIPPIGNGEIFEMEFTDGVLMIVPPEDPP